MELKHFKKGRFNKRMKWAGGVLWICLIALFGCGHDGVPLELIGEWETSARHYEDCTLTISPETVAFKNGKNHSLFFKVHKVQVILNGWVTHYVLHYKNDDGKIYKLSFSLRKTPEGGEIQFSNQQELRWTRKALYPNAKPRSTRSSTI